MTSSKSLRIPYTLESQDLSLPAFVSSYGRAFPQAAIVTQGYCPVDGEEDSEEFSSGEIFIACLKKTIRVLRVELLGGFHKVSVPINSTLQFALLPQEDDGEPEKRLGKEWERKVTSVTDVLEMRILPPAFKVLEDCVDHKQRRVPGGVVLYNITAITMRGLHKKRGIRGISSNQIAHKFLEGQNICFSSRQDDTRSIPAAFIDSINLPQKARVFHGDLCTEEPQQSSWMRQLDHLSVCVFTARCEDEFLVVKTNVQEGSDLPQNVVSVPLIDKYLVRAITLTNYDLKPLAAGRQWIKKASTSNILRDPENPYVAMPIDTAIPDESDPLEHIYDIIPVKAPEAACVRTASFGSPQELALRMQQQQQQQQEEVVYDVPGTPRPAPPHTPLVEALLAHVSEDPRKGTIPPHIIGLINEVHSELLRHNITVFGGPSSPYMPSFPVNRPLTPQLPRHYQRPVHQASSTLPSGGRHGGGHAYKGPSHNLHYAVPSNLPLARKAEASKLDASSPGPGERQSSNDTYEDVYPLTDPHTPTAVYDDSVHTQRPAAQQMVSGKPNPAPSSFQQSPSTPTRKQPPPLLPKPSLQKVANAKSSPSRGSPVTARGVTTSGQHVQSDVAQSGTVVMQSNSPLAQGSTAGPGQQSPVPLPRKSVPIGSPTPKPRRPKSDFIAARQVHPTNQD